MCEVLLCTRYRTYDHGIILGMANHSTIQLKLLSDIVKASGLPPQALLRTIVDYNVQPEWNHIPLPEGKSLLVISILTVMTTGSP